MQEPYRRRISGILNITVELQKLPRPGRYGIERESGNYPHFEIWHDLFAVLDVVLGLLSGPPTTATQAHHNRLDGTAWDVVWECFLAADTIHPHTNDIVKQINFYGHVDTALRSCRGGFYSVSAYWRWSTENDIRRWQREMTAICTGWMGIGIRKTTLSGIKHVFHWQVEVSEWQAGQTGRSLILGHG